MTNWCQQGCNLKCQISCIIQGSGSCGLRAADKKEIACQWANGLVMYNMRAVNEKCQHGLSIIITLYSDNLNTYPQ